MRVSLSTPNPILLRENVEPGQKVPFTLQEHVKTTKADKKRFFFATKDAPVTWQANVSECSNSATKYSKKMFKLYVNHKIPDNIGDVNCPTGKNGKCVYINFYFLGQ